MNFFCGIHAQKKSFFDVWCHKIMRHTLKITPMYVTCVSESACISQLRKKDEFRIDASVSVQFVM